MAVRNEAQAQQAQKKLRQIVGYSAADEIEKLNRLKTAGSISEQEYGRIAGSFGAVTNWPRSQRGTGVALLNYTCSSLRAATLFSRALSTARSSRLLPPNTFFLIRTR